jgi:hypothetical protein
MVEKFQWLGAQYQVLPVWFWMVYDALSVHTFERVTAYDTLILRLATPNGEVHINPGDWVINGEGGMIHVCRLNAFQMSCELVGTTTTLWKWCSSDRDCVRRFTDEAMKHIVSSDALAKTLKLRPYSYWACQTTKVLLRIGFDAIHDGKCWTWVSDDISPDRIHGCGKDDFCRWLMIVCHAGIEVLAEKMKEASKP